MALFRRLDSLSILRRAFRAAASRFGLVRPLECPDSRRRRAARLCQSPPGPAESDCLRMLRTSIMPIVSSPHELAGDLLLPFPAQPLLKEPRPAGWAGLDLPIVVVHLT